jgi:peptide/nickel transport system substrate-binding protein
MALAFAVTTGIPQAQAHRSHASQHPFYIIGNIFTGAPLNYYNTQGLPFGLLDEIPLGIIKNGVSSPNAAYPALAKSWKLSKDGRTLTVNLQPKAKWSDGKPVTSHDVLVSMEIGFVRGTSQAFFLGSTKAKGAHTVIFKQVAGANYPTFERSVLSQYIAPAHVFQSLLPSDVGSTIAASQYTGTDPTLLQKQKDALNTLQTLQKKIEAYSMPNDVTAGPYVTTTPCPPRHPRHSSSTRASSRSTTSRCGRPSPMSSIGRKCRGLASRSAVPGHAILPGRWIPP